MKLALPVTWSRLGADKHTNWLSCSRGSQSAFVDNQSMIGRHECPLIAERKRSLHMFSMT